MTNSAKVKPKTYKVWYDKKVGGVGSVMVKAHNPTRALKVAIYSVFTGRNFRNPRLIANELYKKPRKQGFQGSGRQN